MSANNFLEIILVSSAALLIPVLFFLAKWQRIRLQANTSPQFGLLVLLTCHSLYIIWKIYADWPTNLFRQLQLPLTAPTESIRAALLRRADLSPNASLPKALEQLLTRLSSLDMRALYIRYGHDAVQECEFCVTSSDFGLYALPTTILSYIREVVLAGILTLASGGKLRWRGYAIGALVGAAFGEAYWLSTVSILIPKDGKNVIMWHDILFCLRHVLFLILPFLIYVAPSSPPLVDSALAATHASLSQAIARLAALRHLRAAVQRSPPLREAAGEWWAQERTEGEWIREDEAVWTTVEKMAAAKGFDNTSGSAESRMRAWAKEVVDVLRAQLLSGPPVRPAT